MLNPGGNFEALREAQGNHITQKCVLDLGNFALTSKGASVIASSEFSADWPASGIINGDRTHINAGAPSVAENGIGGSVWQGANLADVGGNVSEYVTIDLGALYKVNRIKVIWWPDNTKTGNLGSIGGKDFLFERISTGEGGYGEGGYGEGTYGGFTPWAGLLDKSAEVGKAPTTIVDGQVTGNVNDLNVFEDPNPEETQVIKLSISKLQSGNIRARIVAIEITIAVDISDYVSAMSRSRSRDFKLNRRLSTELNLTLINYDRRFSRSHVPTAEETAAGFFNDRIRPNMEVRYFAGFSGLNSQMFTGFIDHWKPTAQSRLVKLKGRDYFKFFINQTVSTNLKTNQSLEALVELLGNLANFPSNMMLLDTTTVRVPFFMPKDKKVLDQMNSLGDAVGDSEVYVDEFGRLNFRSYLNVISHVYFVSDAASFQAGTNDNTDSTTAPGEVRLALSGPNYVPEGTWTGTLSPELEGKVEFVEFQAAYETGPSTSVDFFIRVSDDGGVTFTPWRQVIPGTPMSKWNHYAEQVQVRFRLRSSDPTQTPKVFNFTVKYRSRGGSQQTQDAPVLFLKDSTTMLDLNQVYSDEVGGANYIITKETVKSKPTFLSSGSQDAWIATVNSEAVSPTNPLTVPVGDTTFEVDLGNTQYDVPQTVVMTLGTAVATASITSHPSKPILTITATVAGTISELKLTGTPFVQEGTVEAVVEAEDEIQADYGPQDDVFESNYIDNVDLARDIATAKIARFGQGPIDWLQDVPCRFSPNIQVNDRTRIVEGNTDIDADYVILGAMDVLSASADRSFSAETRAELVKIGSGATVPDPAYYGSGGVFYYDNFRFGGSKDL